VENVIQQTAMNMLKRQGSDYVYNATAYIYAGLRNGALSMIRKKRREVPEDTADEYEGSYAADEAVLMEDLKKQLKTALDQLDERSRYVFMQTELAGKSYRQHCSKAH